MPKKIFSVLLVDDHPLFRQGVAHLINQQQELRICGEAESVDEALALVDRLKPDLALVDLSLRHGSGLELIEHISKQAPATAVVVLSMHDEQHYAGRCLRAGARGYVMKSETPDAVITALHEVASGKIHLSSPMQAFAIERFIDGSARTAPRPEDVLSKRELEVFGQLGRGNDTRKVAELMGVSMKTVQAFCAKIKEKLHLANATELLREAVRWSETNNLGNR